MGIKDIHEPPFDCTKCPRLSNYRKSIKIEYPNWYKSEPYPKLSQPWYVNSIAKITTNKSSENLIKSLHQIEKIFGRKRNNDLSLQENIQTALKYFPDYGIRIIKISNFYKSEPYPKLSQPWYVNSVAKITTNETSENLINILISIYYFN